MWLFLGANFYEKALFVKADVAVALCGRERNGFLPFARYAAIRTFGEPDLLGGSVHRMRSIFSAT
jgi:hypothetical protein